MSGKGVIVDAADGQLVCLLQNPVCLGTAGTDSQVDQAFLRFRLEHGNRCAEPVVILLRLHENKGTGRAGLLAEAFVRLQDEYFQIGSVDADFPDGQQAVLTLADDAVPVLFIKRLDTGPLPAAVIAGAALQPAAYQAVSRFR